MRVLFRVIQTIEEWLLAWAMIGIAVLTIANVFARATPYGSLASADEVSRFLIVLVTFIGLSYAASQGRHIRMTAIYDQLPLGPRKALMVLIAGSTSLLLFYLAYCSIRYIQVVHALGSHSPVLQVPLYLVYLTAPLGLILGGIQYALTVLRNLTTPGRVYMSYDHEDTYEEANVTGGEI